MTIKKMTVVLTELIQRPKQAASLSQQRIFLKSSFIFFFLCVLLERKWNEQYLCYRIFLCRLNFLFCSPFWMLDEPQSKCPAKTRLGTFIFCALSLFLFLFLSRMSCVMTPCFVLALHEEEEEQEQGKS